MILAAGMGTRLRGIQPSLPKGMLEIGGRSLVQRSIEHLYATGISNVLLVTGYRADAYESFLSAAFPTVRTVHNADFARTGSMHSLFLARGKIAGPFLLLESDLLYERRALTTLLAQTAGDHVLVSGETKQGDEVYAYSDAGRLNLLTKTLQPNRTPSGEFAGISRISTEFFESMCVHYEANIPFPSNYHYDDCLSDLSATRPLNVVKVEDLLWGEIDDPAHFERTVSWLLPAIQRSAE